MTSIGLPDFDQLFEMLLPNVQEHFLHDQSLNDLQALFLEVRYENSVSLDNYNAKKTLTIGDLLSKQDYYVRFLKAIGSFDFGKFNSLIFKNMTHPQKSKDGIELCFLHENIACIFDLLSNDYLVSLLRKGISEKNVKKYNDLIVEAKQNYKHYELICESEQQLSSLLNISLKDWCQDSFTLLDYQTKVQKSIDNIQTIEQWCQYWRQREKMLDLGLMNPVRMCESKTVSPDQFLSSVEYGLYHSLSRQVIVEDPYFAGFSSSEQMILQNRFKECDRALIRLQSEYIAWKLGQATIPEGIQARKLKDLTEGSLLRHETTKSAKYIPIRRLFEKAGKAILEIKPCFMMGPMSVAQYLKPGYLEFDILIMDEASQIKPEDALGSVARAKQVVIVGDAKQLPPTNFFNRNFQDEIDEDERTIIEESESILDALSSLFISRRLRWHYRSQHQNLIAFSNKNYYNNDLIVFPSPHEKNPRYGINYTHLEDGVFDEGVNRVEALHIIKILHQQLESESDETVGIIAMNAKQQEFIEACIEAAVKDDPVFRRLIEIDQERTESIFVKNLENVQGDERDIIIISMTYGPKEVGGRVFQRFGPINSDLGWRRLNVLLTRARKRMNVLSSMRSDDILVKSDSKKGVQDLRAFLSYCETGVLHDTKLINVDRGFDSDFEASVAEMLAKKGYVCQPQVGVEGFYIDLAVINPDNPASFLLGIECDGATYHSSKSARDRDRLRQDVLERLGWKIHRIWSTDWFKNPQSQIDKIVRIINDSRKISID